MTVCNFKICFSTHDPDAEAELCGLCSGPVPCAEENCILRRILALDSIPIVAKTIPAIGTGPDGALQYKVESITIAEPNQPPEQKPQPNLHNGKYRQTQVAEMLGVTAATICVHSQQHNIGERTGGKKYYTEADIEKLRGFIGKPHVNGRARGKRGPYKKRNTNCNTEGNTEGNTPEKENVIPKVIPSVIPGVIQPNPAERTLPQAVIDHVHKGLVLDYYKENTHLRITPEAVAAKLHLAPQEVKNICAQLNEENLLSFAGSSGYYCRGR